MTNPYIPHSADSRPAHPGRSRPRAAVSALTALSTATALGLSLTAAPARAAAGASGTTKATTTTTLAASTTVQHVTLVTGEHIDAITQNGSTRYSIEGVAGGNGQLSTYQLPNGDRYDIPAEARPYLSRQLPLSLFDTSALIRSGTTGDARIPVELSFAAGATPTAPPGVTLTSTAANTATGYLTPDSAAQFAAGLRAAIGADVRAGRAAGTGTLFGGLVSMSPAASFAAMATLSSPVTSSPRYPLHILQINATDLTGAPVSNAPAFLINTDAVASYSSFVPIADGIARVAVPAGHYFTTVPFDEFDGQGNVTSIHYVTINDFAVAAAGVTTITVAESSATTPFTVTTPRASTQDEAVTIWSRQDAAGATSGFGSIDFAAAPQFFNAQPSAQVGKLRFTEQWGGAGPATGAQYRYDLAYAYDDIPAAQTHAIKPAELATVQQVLYIDPAAQRGTSLQSGPTDSNQTIGAELYSGNLTQYLGGNDGTQWSQIAFTNGFGTAYFAEPHTFAAGHHYRTEWAHAPLTPNVGTHNGAAFFACFACASTDGVRLAFGLVGDSDPSHTGLPFFDTLQTHYTLYVDGTVVADAGGVIGAQTGPPDATGPTTYREVYDTDRTGNPDISQSTVTHTDVSFVYDSQTDPGPALPSDVFCALGGTAPCHIMPVLSLSYHLATDTTNTSGSPLQALLLNVNHLSYDGLGSHAAITSASVSVSFDGGKTWQPALVVGAAGTYVALWQNPKSAAGTSPTIKVSATDAAGGSITQTVSNAYTIASAVS